MHTADLEADPRDRLPPNRNKDRAAAIVTKQLNDELAVEAEVSIDSPRCSNDVEASRGRLVT